MYKLAPYSIIFVISDLPGIGESNYADNHYYDWYKEMLELDCQHFFVQFLFDHF